MPSAPADCVGVGVGALVEGCALRHELIQTVAIAGDVVHVVVIAGAVAVAIHTTAGGRSDGAAITGDMPCLEETRHFLRRIVGIQNPGFHRLLVGLVAIDLERPVLQIVGCLVFVQTQAVVPVRRIFQELAHAAGRCPSPLGLVAGHGFLELVGVDVTGIGKPTRAGLITADIALPVGDGKIAAVALGEHGRRDEASGHRIIQAGDVALVVTVGSGHCFLSDISHLLVSSMDIDG